VYRASTSQEHERFVDGDACQPSRKGGLPFEPAQVHESLVEALLDNVFRIFPDACVPQHNPKDLLPVTVEKRFKRLLVSMPAGSDKQLFGFTIIEASNGWCCRVVHNGLPISYVPAKGEVRFSLLPSLLHMR
jgi:hypothetical protein